MLLLLLCALLALQLPVLSSAYYANLVISLFSLVFPGLELLWQGAINFV
jgi:hypothetical protein